MAGIGGWGRRIAPASRAPVAPPVSARIVWNRAAPARITPQTMAATHSAQRATPVAAVVPRNYTDLYGRALPRWQTGAAPYRRYALRKAQVAAQERALRDLHGAMRARVAGFLG